MVGAGLGRHDGIERGLVRRDDGGWFREEEAGRHGTVERTWTTSWLLRIDLFVGILELVDLEPCGLSEFDGDAVGRRGAERRRDGGDDLLARQGVDADFLDQGCLQHFDGVHRRERRAEDLPGPNGDDGGGARGDVLEVDGRGGDRRCQQRRVGSGFLDRHSGGLRLERHGRRGRERRQQRTERHGEHFAED